MGIDKYLWKNMDKKSKKIARKQWKKGETVDCLTWNLDGFLATIISEYMECYLDKASKIIIINNQEKEDIKFMINFFKAYKEGKYDWLEEYSVENFEEDYNKAFNLLKKYFSRLWW